MSKGLEPSGFKSEEFKVTFSDFVSYLNEVGMHMHCNACGSEKGWDLDISNPSGIGEDTLTTYRMPFAEGPTFRTFFSMSCMNCGSMRHISAPKVMAKLDSMRKSNDGA